MPNGKPGDHPLTDIVVHRMTVFGPVIDDLVRELSQKLGFEKVERRVADILWDNWCHWQNVRCDYGTAHQQLLALKQELEEQAKCP
jgi:hypothetical protein